MCNISVRKLKATYEYRGTDRMIDVIIKLDVKEARCEDVGWTWHSGGPCEDTVTCPGFDD
jgi:hypothetical protein